MVGLELKWNGNGFCKTLGTRISQVTKSRFMSGSLHPGGFDFFAQHSSPKSGFFLQGFKGISKITIVIKEYSYFMSHASERCLKSPKVSGSQLGKRLVLLYRKVNLQSSWQRFFPTLLGEFFSFSFQWQLVYLFSIWTLGDSMMLGECAAVPVPDTTLPAMKTLRDLDW